METVRSYSCGSVFLFFFQQHPKQIVSCRMRPFKSEGSPSGNYEECSSFAAVSCFFDNKFFYFSASLRIVGSWKSEGVVTRR